LNRLLGGVFSSSNWSRQNVVTHIGQGRLPCPSGHGSLTILEVASTRGPVEIDVCRSCRGVWLDAREAQRLQHATPVPAPPVISPPLIGDAPPEAVSDRSGLSWYLFMLFSGMPVEVYNPTRKIAVACLLMVLLCGGVFVYELKLLTSHSSEAIQAFVHTWGAVPAALSRGQQLLSVFTYVFLHGSLMHLLGNMWFLWTFGDNVEDRVGHRRFIILYFSFALCALVAQFFFMDDMNVPLIGASGAISGLMGTYLALFPRAAVYTVILFIRWRVPAWIYLGVWVAIQTLLSLTTLDRVGAQPVAFAAHVGGFIAGFVWGMLNRNKYGEQANL
jgi:membrane associated rhomboid family serine protease